MAFDYTKLTADVKAAMQAGSDAAALVADRGSCNLDGVILELPRLPLKKVMEAIELAGTSTVKITSTYFRGYMINPNEGQADKRYTACEAIRKSLREAGYTVTPYYQMD